MPRGKKTCPSCNALVGARVGLCDCGHKFSPSKKKQPKPFFSARKNFIKIKYFLTKEGKEYLRKKHKEFYYKPPDKDKYLDTKEKAGQDILESKKKTLKDFLNE